MQYRKTSSHSSLTDSQVADIRLMAMRGLTQTEIAEEVGVHRKTVYNIIERNTWNHVPDPVRPYGFRNYLVFPDGRVYSSVSDKFITPTIRANGEQVVRINNSSGNRVTIPVANLVARGYYGSRRESVTYRDGNPSNTHFTNISV
jgi:hypothetical protein